MSRPSAEHTWMVSKPEADIGFPFGCPGVGVEERAISASAARALDDGLGDFFPSIHDMVDYTRPLETMRAVWDPRKREKREEKNESACVTVKSEKRPLA